MEYTVLALCRLAGVTSRALRYYDEIGLLSPGRKASGYRIYGQAEVDRLQQVLFYRELGIPLQAIREILDAPGYNALEELRKHREKVLNEQKRLDALARNLNRTIASMEGELIMTDTEKFEGFKQSLVDENERKYGREIREKYGDEAVDGSYAKLKGMDAGAYKKMKELEEKIKEQLKAAMQTGCAEGREAFELVKLHRDWLCMYWNTYSPEAHENLARMYVEDERFRAYYDEVAPGAAEFLRDTIVCHAKNIRS